VVRRDVLTLAALLLALPPVAGATVRYVRSENLIVVEHGATATLSGLKAALPEAPLRRVDPAGRIWLLAANLLVTDGSTLRLHGKAAGGDVNELRLKSDNTRGPNAFVALTADHGVIDIRATHITSWDTAADTPDYEYETFGRAFIRARSRMRSMVLIPLQSRMDIIDSEIAFLGYNASESYGVVWKVVARDPFVFEYVRVYGDVIRSRIHDNYFGLYASGARGSSWRSNEVYHNARYGLAPHNRSDDLHIEDNDVHDNGHHGITVRQHCARVVIRNNRVWGNGESGITLHRGSNGGLIASNRIYRNVDTGIMIYDSARASVRDNVVRENGQGIHLAMGSSDSRIEDNEIGDNGIYGLFVGKGRGRPESGDGHPRRNELARNVVYGSGTEDLRLGDPALNHGVDNAVVARHEMLPTPAGDAPAELPPGAAPILVAAADAVAVDAGGDKPPAVIRAPTGRDWSLLLWRLRDSAPWAGAAALVLAFLLIHGAGTRRR
jgi:mannuronan 5-epimerase